MNTDMTPDEVMDHAADLIDEHGWCRNSYELQTGEMCVVGALDRVCSQWDMQNESDTFDEAISFLMTTIGKDVTEWNDNICKDHYMATELLRNEAKRYRERN
jgi:hypothetical protein